jgi:hypothetical protein
MAGKPAQERGRSPKDAGAQCARPDLVLELANVFPRICEWIDARTLIAHRYGGNRSAARPADLDFDPYLGGSASLY